MRFFLLSAALVVVAGAVFLFFRYNVSIAFTYLVGLCLICVGLLYCAWFFFYSNSKTFVGNASPKMVLWVAALSIIGALILEGATLVGAPMSSPFNIQDWSKKELLIFFALSVSVIVAILSKENLRASGLHAAGSHLQKRDRPSRPFLSLGNPLVCLVVILLANLCLGFLVFALGGLSFSFMGRALYLLLSITLGGVFSYYYVKRLPGHPEFLFISIALSLGLFLCMVLPPVTGISPDDQIHYVRSLGLSYLGGAQYSEADISLFSVPWIESNVLQFDEIRDAVASLNLTHQQSILNRSMLVAPGMSAAVTSEPLLTLSTIGYLPSAFGLWLGRLFGAPLLVGFMMGRIANLLCYVLVVAYAVRITPLKKCLMCVIGLLPTGLYLAANYSYDPWVISFLMLAVALTLREISRKEHLLTLGGATACAFAFFLGLAPKAIYCPLIGLMLLMPASKFRSGKSHYLYVAGVIAFGLVMTASFVLPMLFSSATQAGDSRGGEGVNALGQIIYILSHPVEYIQTLFSFIARYISPSTSNDYSLNYTYMGQLVSVAPFLSSVPLISVLLTGATDGDCDRPLRLGWGSVIWVEFVVLLCVILATTSLYVSFTAVGATTVAGMQGRYLLPLLYPALAVAFSRGKVARNETCYNSGAYRCGVIAVMAVFSILLNCCFVLSW